MNSGMLNAVFRTAAGISCTVYPGPARRASYMRWLVSSDWTFTSSA